MPCLRLSKLPLTAVLDHCDTEASRAVATLPEVPHCRVRCLDVTAEPIGVEEGMSQAVLRQFLLQPAEQRWIARQLQGQCLVSLQAFGDQFRKTDGHKQACRD